MRENVELSRDVQATMIPEGTPIPLKKGMQVTITQALGGSYTVITDQGFMARIEGADADTLGKEAVKAPSAEELAKIPLDKLIWNQLKTVYDPEIPVDIASLGLIYTCDLEDCDDGKKKVFIQMTLTAPGCGMGDTLRAEVQRKVESLPGVKDVRVELVWEPQWNQDMMSDAAKLKLGML